MASCEKCGMRKRRGGVGGLTRVFWGSDGRFGRVKKYEMWCDACIASNAKPCAGTCEKMWEKTTMFPMAPCCVDAQDKFVCKPCRMFCGSIVSCRVDTCSVVAHCACAVYAHDGPNRIFFNCVHDACDDLMLCKNHCSVAGECCDVDQLLAQITDYDRESYHIETPHVCHPCKAACLQGRLEQHRAATQANTDARIAAEHEIAVPECLTHSTRPHGRRG